MLEVPAGEAVPEDRGRAQPVICDGEAEQVPKRPTSVSADAFRAAQSGLEADQRSFASFGRHGDRPLRVPPLRPLPNRGPFYG